MRVATSGGRKIRKEEKQRAETEMALKGNLTFLQSNPGGNNKALNNTAGSFTAGVCLPPQPCARAMDTEMGRLGGCSPFPRVNLKSTSLWVKIKE